MSEPSNSFFLLFGVVVAVVVVAEGFEMAISKRRQRQYLIVAELGEFIWLFIDMKYGYKNRHTLESYCLCFGRSVLVWLGHPTTENGCLYQFSFLSFFCCSINYLFIIHSTTVHTYVNMYACMALRCCSSRNCRLFVFRILFIKWKIDGGAK